MDRGMAADIWRRFRRNRAALTCLIIIAIMIVIAIIAPLIAPYGYSDTDFGAANRPPGNGHLFGTDKLGRDVFSRILYGTRISLAVGIVAQLIMIGIGVPLGLLAGFKGGTVDMAIMRIVDILYSFPALLFIILFMSLLKGLFATADASIILIALASFDRTVGGLLGVFISLGLISWLTVCRIVRGEVLALNERDFIQAARALGMSGSRIMLRHLLPNVAPSVIVAATFGIPAAIMMEAGLSFLGLGVEPPMPSWGSMLSEGVSAIRSYPHLLVFPGLALALTMIVFNLLGDGLRTALDPYTRRR